MMPVADRFRKVGILHDDFESAICFINDLTANKDI